MKRALVLSEQDGAFLSAVHDLGELSVQESARKHNVNAITLNRKFGLWREKNKIRRGVLINWPLLGIWPVNIFFSLSAHDTKACLDHIKLHPQVSWLSENLSSKRYEATLLCRDLAHLAAFFDDVSQKFGAAIIDPIWACEIRWKYWQIRMGSSSSGTKEFYVQRAAPKFDEIDTRLIDRLRRSNDSLPTVARALSMPVSTVHERIKRLKASGVIEAVY